MTTRRFLCVTMGLLFELVLVLICALMLAGCTDAQYALQRTLISADCRPDHLQANGHCTPLK